MDVVELFRKAGTSVGIAALTREAHRRRGRDGEQPAQTAGLTLIRELAEQKAAIPVIVCAASFESARGVPRGVFAYTSDAANLVQFGIGVRAPA